MQPPLPSGVIVVLSFVGHIMQVPFVETTPVEHTQDPPVAVPTKVNPLMQLHYTLFTIVPSKLGSLKLKHWKQFPLKVM